MKFIDLNVLKGTTRRLTLQDGKKMSQVNMKKLKDAYKHPFEKIPMQYFGQEHKY